MEIENSKNKLHSQAVFETIEHIYETETGSKYIVNDMSVELEQCEILYDKLFDFFKRTIKMEHYVVNVEMDQFVGEVLTVVFDRNIFSDKQPFSIKKILMNIDSVLDEYLSEWNREPSEKTHSVVINKYFIS